MSVPVSRWQVAPNAGKWVIWEPGTGRKVAVVDLADDAYALAGIPLEAEVARLKDLAAKQEETTVGLARSLNEVAEERDQLRAQVAAAVAETNRVGGAAQAYHNIRAAVYQHEREALRRAESQREDLEAAAVNRDPGDEGAQDQPPGAAVAPTGQAGGEQSVSAGPPAGLSPLAAAVWRARGGSPPPHFGAGASAGYTGPLGKGPGDEAP